MTVYYERPRDFLEVRGPEAATYLQGQLSQDVEVLPVGEARPSFVLQPTGKVDSWIRVLRVGDEKFVLDVDVGWGEAVASRLKRFLLRTKAEITPLDWSCLALRGSDAAEVAGMALKETDGGPVNGMWVVGAPWPPTRASEAFDVVGPEVEPLPQAPDLGVDVDESGTAADYDALRISVGVPAMGSELTESTIPAEVGQWVIDQSVSFTKGCFTGQELVARVDSRGGNVPRHLRRLQLSSGAEVPPVGATIEVDGAEVGKVTSAGVWPDGPPVALGFVKRSVTPPAEGVLRWDGGEAQVTLDPPLDPRG